MNNLPKQHALPWSPSHDVGYQTRTLAAEGVLGTAHTKAAARTESMGPLSDILARRNAAVNRPDWPDWPVVSQSSK